MGSWAWTLLLKLLSTDKFSLMLKSLSVFRRELIELTNVVDRHWFIKDLCQQPITAPHCLTWPLRNCQVGLNCCNSYQGGGWSDDCRDRSTSLIFININQYSIIIVLVGKNTGDYDEWQFLIYLFTARVIMLKNLK